jgi:hypothetical protein
MKSIVRSRSTMNSRVLETPVARLGFIVLSPILYGSTRAGALR